MIELGQCSLKARVESMNWKCETYGLCFGSLEYIHGTDGTIVDFRSPILTFPLDVDEDMAFSPVASSHPATENFADSSVENWLKYTKL